MTLKDIISLLSLTATLSFWGCRQKAQPCLESTALNQSNGHLTSIADLSEIAPEFLDSLQAHPQLQVYKLLQQGDQVRMDCYVYHEGLRLYFATYNLLKNLQTGSLNRVGKNKLIYPININLQPSVSWLDAVVKAREQLDFGNSCQHHTLGIIEKAPEEYYLVWCISEEGHTSRYVMLDAHTNEVLEVNNDLWF